MIASMRTWRSRAAVVLTLAVLHVGAGVVSALAPCCNRDVHAGSRQQRMDCCLKGGPNHICPFMSASRRSKAPGKINVYCPMGHDTGMPVAGFGAMPETAVSLVRTTIVAQTQAMASGDVIRRVIHPPTPPPKDLL